jgi:2-desacetyl-2-hydroxyethyl bacteriochlorophyllide A dehydrogenase
MRALVYTAPRQLELQHLPRPCPAAGETEIAVVAAGICGSDIAAFLGRSRSRVPPMVLGHELVGRAPDGRRVVANPFLFCGRCPACLGGAQNLCSSWRLLGMNQTPGCFAEFVAIPGTHLHAIPDSLSDAQAILAEPLANIVHLLRLAAPDPGFRMGIVGAGTMGSLALLAALHHGVREVLVEEASEPRLASARRMGATLAVHPDSEAGRAEARQFAGEGLDLVLDASGAAAAREEAFHLCRPGGQVVLLGMADARSEIDFAAAIRREQRVILSFGYTPPDFVRSLELLAAGAIDLTPWIAELPLEAGQQAVETISSSPGSTLKMLLRVAR